jgi:four helix bundle protein
MLNQFRTYKIAVEFHQLCQTATLPAYLRDQLLRASSSIALNLAEGYGRSTHKDQLRFFHIAMGSLRESQAALDLAPKKHPILVSCADKLGAHLFRLCHHRLGVKPQSITKVDSTECLPIR